MFKSDDKQNIVQLHALVSGQVQGVGFRWFVMKHARSMSISGWVKNLNNGKVEVKAEGLKTDLEDLLARLHQGPSYSRVTDVDFQWSKASGMPQGFDVGY